MINALRQSRNGNRSNHSRAGQGNRKTSAVGREFRQNQPEAVRYDRIPVTTPARTLTDLPSVLPFTPLRRAVREALVRKRITADEAKSIVKGGDQPTRSSLEDAVLDLIEAHGLPAPQVKDPEPGPHVSQQKPPPQLEVRRLELVGQLLPELLVRPDGEIQRPRIVLRSRETRGIVGERRARELVLRKAVAH